MFHFRVGPFPVRVFGSFFLLAALFGYRLLTNWPLFLAWIFVVFVSVLVHELGHALVGRALGGAPEIHLVGLGGVTFPNLKRRPGALRSILLSFAGPFFGLLLGGAAWLLKHALPPSEGSLSEFVVDTFQFTSVVWAVFNLLPILPLDGGNIMHAAIEGVRKKPSEGLTSAISAVVAGLIAALSYFAGQTFLALWCLAFAVQNGSRAVALRRPARPPPSAPRQPASVDPFEQADVDSATERAREALKQHDVDAALVFAERLEQKGGVVRQAAGLRLRAGIELARGDNEAAALYAGQSFSVLPTPDAAVVAARANLRAGQVARAQNWLKRAVEAGAQPAAVRADPELGALG